MRKLFNLQKQEHCKSKYIVFIDLDGTFLNSQKQIPKENIELLNYADNNDILIVPTTGRTLMGIPDEILSHPSVSYVICSNGATIYDLETKQIISHKGITKEEVLSIYEKIKHLNIQFDVFADDYIYSQKERLKNIHQFHLDQPTLDYVLKTRTVFNEPIEEMILKVKRIDRLNIFYNNKKDYDLIINILSQIPQVIVSSSLITNIEINARNAHKGQAILDLMSFLQIPIEKSIAFGDSYNDITMLENVHDGVAMANAITECHRVAIHKTTSCDDAGVANYLFSLWEKDDIDK